MARRRIVFEALVALAVGVAVAVVLTWPLAAEANSVAHDPYDPRFQAWTLDWVQHALGHPTALFDGGLFDANIFAPERGTLAYSDALLGVAVPLLPLRWLGATPVGQLNAALLLGYGASAAAAYALGRVVAGSVAVGAVAGAVFAFGPYGSAEGGHLQVVMRPGVALAPALVWVLAERSTRGAAVRWPAVALAAVLAWQGSVSFYPGAYAFVAVAVVAAWRLRALGWQGLLAVAVASGVAAAALGVLALPYLARRAALPTYRWDLSDLAVLGADFARTDPRLVVWGGLLGRGEGWPVSGVAAFPGLVAVALGVRGLAAARRADATTRRAAATGLVLVAVGAVLAVGASDQGWRRFAPYRFLFEHAPGFDGLRATGRAWAIGLAGLGLLAGLGARALARGSRWRAAAWAAGAAFLVLAEGYAPWGPAVVPVGVATVDRELARRAEPGGVLYLPVNTSGTGVANLAIFTQPDFVYRTTAHHRRTPNGYSGYFPPSYFETSRLVLGLPDSASLERLRSVGVRFVVVGPAARATPPWDRLTDPARAAPLRLVGRYGDDLLYEVPPAG